MTERERYTAVVDRIEGDLAVLLLERGSETVGDLVVSRADLPADARAPDAVLSVTIEDDELVEARYDDAETERRAERAQSRFDRLADRAPDDADDEDG